MKSSTRDLYLGRVLPEPYKRENFRAARQPSLRLLQDPTAKIR